MTCLALSVLHGDGEGERVAIRRALDLDHRILTPRAAAARAM
jgi:hypothetical protein